MKFLQDFLEEILQQIPSGFHQKLLGGLRKGFIEDSLNSIRNPERNLSKSLMPSEGILEESSEMEPVRNLGSDRFFSVIYADVDTITLCSSRKSTSRRSLTFCSELIKRIQIADDNGLFRAQILSLEHQLCSARYIFQTNSIICSGVLLQ